MSAKKTGFLVIAIFFVSFLYAQDPRDTLKMYQRDSVVTPPTEATVLFFQQGDKIPDNLLGKTLLISKTKKVTKLSAVLNNKNVQYTEHALADLDNDGKKELVINDNTGGAHCCDEIFIYKNIGPNKYQLVVRLFAGQTVITPSNQFLYELHENFGYFFTCYACAYSDTSDEAPIDVSRLTLNYKNGKMTVVQTESELKSIINDNLAKLGEQPYTKPEDNILVDDGLRKEFALNLATWYFTFGKNMATTQQLFNKYFKYPDAKKVWSAFSKQLLAIRAENDF